MTTAQAIVAAGAWRRSRYDPWLLAAVVALLATGMVMVYSATVARSATDFGNSLHFLRLQCVFIVIGGCCMWAVSRAPVAWWRRAARVLLVGSLILLIAVLIPFLGIEVNGSRRWLPFGPVRLQPSELAKLAVVVYGADYLARRADELRQFRVGVVTPLVVVGSVAALMLLEPDLGSAVVMVGALFGMLFLAGVRILHFALCAVTGLAGVVALTALSPYRMQRVVSFLHPFDDPYDSGFQLVQALIAIGRGEWLGVGLGASIQKLFYLPHASTDFLLAVVGEELGLLGITAVVTLFAILLWRAFAIARGAADRGDAFGAYLAAGVGLLLSLQALINMGVNLGVLPTKGLTLPFMSYGGSSLIVSCIAVGLLLRIDRETHGAGRRTRR